MLDWFAQIDWFAVICWLSAVSLIIAGLAGTVIPAIPGLPLIAAGGALIGWAGGFELIGWGTIATLAVLAIIGVIVDTVAQTAGAQKAGASSYGIWGSVIGTFVTPPKRKGFDRQSRARRGFLPPECNCLRGGIADAHRHWFCYTTCLCFYYPLPLCPSCRSTA